MIVRPRFLKADPGRIGLASVEGEVAKLSLIRDLDLRDLDLPERLWAGASPKLLVCYRARAATESARELRRHAAPVRYTLLSAFCWQRRREITDGLVDLLIQIVHRVSVRAEKRVTAEMVGELQRVEGKTDLLFRTTGACCLRGMDASSSPWMDVDWKLHTGFAALRASFRV